MARCGSNKELEGTAPAAPNLGVILINIELTIACVSIPLLLFAQLFECVLQARQRTLNFADLTFELARVESDFNSTGTGEFTVRLYPSDAFLCFVAALFA